MIPKIIEDKIKDMKLKEITECHRSGDTVYQVADKYILKISDNVARLQKEYEKDNWIYKYLPSPKPIEFIVEDNKAYYLREYLKGDILCMDKYLLNPTLLVGLLAQANNIIHKTIIDEKKYIIDEGYNTLIHGDCCLPNILVKDDKVVGFIDLGDSGIGDPWQDYAWSIWSLEYNLKTNKYTNLLLEKLNIEFDKEKFNKYINE